MKTLKELANLNGRVALITGGAGHPSNGWLQLQHLPFSRLYLL